MKWKNGNQYLIFSILILFLSECSQSIDIMRDPGGNSGTGLVAFGLFIHHEGNTRIDLTQPSMVYLEESESAGQMNLESHFRNLLFNNGKIKVYLTDSMVLGQRGIYYLTTKLDPTKQYRLSSVGYIITTVTYTGNGNRIYSTTPVSFPIERQSSPLIVSSPGELKYLGLFAVTIKAIAGTGFSFLKIGEKKMGLVENGVPLLNQLEKKEYQSVFFGKESLDEKGNEIHFLKLLLQRQMQGYWYGKAWDRLRELLL